MNRILYSAVLLAVCLAGLLPQQAVAQSLSGPYLEARAGAVFVEDGDFDEFGVTGELTYDPGYALNLAFGYAFETGLRLEIDAAYRKSDVDDVKIDGFGTFDAAADLITFTSMANLYYDFDAARMSGDPRGASPVVPFLGAGIGVAIHELDFDSGGSETDAVFAYQGIAGLAFSVASHWRMTLTYIYLRTSDPEFEDFETEYRSHNAMFGIRYSF